MKLLRILKQNSTSKEKITLILIGLCYGCFHSIFNAWAIWYQNPKTFCKDGGIHSCSIKEACKSKYYSIDYKNSPKSISTQFGLICEKEGDKNFAMITTLAGCWVGALFSLLYTPPKSYRKTYLGLLTLLNAFSSFLIIFFQNNLFIISLLMFNLSFAQNPFKANSVVLFYEIFNKEFGKVANSVVMCIYGSIGFTNGVIAYFSNSNWKILFLYQFCIAFIFGLFLLLIPIERHFVEEKRV